MMSRVLLGFCCALLFMAHSAHAQLLETTVSLPFQAVISGPNDVTVGRTVVLNGSLSQLADADDVTYQWFVNGIEQPISESVEALFTPEQPGELIFRLIVESADGQLRSTIEHQVIAYSRKIVLVADPHLDSEKLELHRADAVKNGIFLRIIKPASLPPRLGTEDAWVQLFSEQRTAFLGAETIVLWSDDIAVLQALMRTVQTDAELQLGMSNQTIVLLTHQSPHRLARTARGSFSTLKPLRIVVASKEAINPLIASINTDEFLTDTQRRDIPLEIINNATGAIRPWNLLSSFINYLLTSGVSSEAVILLLMLPFIATILAFMKQVIGITTLGLYTPSVIALSLIALGWQLGLLFLLWILATGYGVRALIRRWRLLYIPKVAIILTVVSLTLLLLLGIVASFGITLTRETIFILLIMSTLNESFLNLKAEAGWWSAIVGVGEAVLASVVCVLLVQWAFFQSLILAYPELVFLTVLANAMLGRWTGLRLVEYFRFKEVFRHLQEE